jgi:CRP/FNR family cyclic AMP-dependent transcriptional regulator
MGADPLTWLALLSAGVAALLVVISAFVKTMIPLRWLAVASNAGFIVYGLLHPAPLMVALHAVLLPVNLWRVWQMIGLTRRVAATRRRPADGTVVAPLHAQPPAQGRRSAVCQRRLGRPLYFVASGQVELPEVGGTVQAGQMFGEIAFFAPGHRRSSSARCLTDCTLLSIDETTFRELVYQNPDFGLEVVRLIAGRLSEDVRRCRRSRWQRPDYTGASRNPGWAGLSRPTSLICPCTGAA